MLQRMRAGCVTIAGLIACVSAVARSQDSGVRSVAVPAHSEVAVAPLDRTIALSLRQVSLKEALTILATRARIQVAYSVTRVPVDQLVSIEAGAITVRDALAVLLDGTGLTASVSRAGRVVIEPGRVRASQGVATITGHVTDGALKTPLSEVSVRVEGTALRTTANTDGKYAITGVAPGTYRMTARRVGYQALTKEITVAGDQTATLDFALIAAPTRLDEIVTTAVGQQRRYEVGNDISTINADSITPTAPITSLTDLISARAPGVQVLETGGLTGSGEAIRIQGLTSLVLQNDPILIVDGVRQDNSAGSDILAMVGGNGTHPTPTRLNDIDFNDIETIDILKGPSASTEYGTDAANGVIVITTKHGASGRPQWRASAEQTESEIPTTWPELYYSWGHSTDGTGTAVNCPITPLYGGYYAQYGAPYNVGSIYGVCIVDSVTHENPLNQSSTSAFGTGTRGKYDLGVSGGSDAVRYYVAGALTNETGIVRLPSVFRELADTAGLTLPRASYNPNTEDQRSVRVNTAIRLGPTADLTANASYLSTYQQTPEASGLYNGALTSPAIADAAHIYGYGSPGSLNQSPIGQFSAIGSDNVDRVTGGLTGNWRPAQWFAGYATAGLDHGSARNQNIVYPLANPAYGYFTGGYLGLGNTTTDIYSVDVRGTATVGLFAHVRAATSVGVQMVDTRTAGQTAFEFGLTATNLTLNGATNPSVDQVGDRQATLGGYGEEQISIAERLFLIGAVRVDGASGFGSAYSTAAYPKASISWLLLDAGATTVRLRGAFGESGVQPLNGAALQTYYAIGVYTGGGTTSGLRLQSPGNPNLRPERTTEFEGGVDLTGWGNRLTLELTGYSKLTHDALVNENLGLLTYSYQENIGEVRNAGVEAALTATILQSRWATWEASVNASVNHNKLVSLAPGVSSQMISGPAAAFRQEPGYPLYGLWGRTTTYSDGNHDGVIEPGEVTVADSATYIGPSLPTQEVSVATHVGIFKGAVTLGALVDYRGGYRLANTAAFYGAEVANQMGQNIETAPLWQQERDELTYVFPEAAVYYEDASFVRFRELSLTYSLPRRALRVVRLQSATVTGAVRNLALWTRYSGSDPEATNSAGFNVNQGTPGLNNDIREDYGAIPLARYWVVRLNVGL